MKSKNLFITLGLAVTLGVAGLAGVSMMKGAETVDAATATTVYCAIDATTLGTYSMKVNINEKGDGDQWKTYDMTDTGDTYESKKVFVGSFTSAYDGLGCIQFQLLDGSTWKEQDQVFGTRTWTTPDVYNNKLHVYGGSGWVAYTPDVVTASVVLVDKEGNEATPYEAQVSKGGLPANPTLAYGDHFDGWYSDKECTVKVTGISTAMTVYAKKYANEKLEVTVDVSAVEALATPYYYGWDEHGVKNADWPGVAIADGKIEVPTNASFLIANAAGTVQTVDISLEGATDTLKVLATQTEGKYNYEWYAAPVAANYAFKVNGGAAVEMDPNPENEEEYLSKTAVTLHKGDVITFTKDGEAMAVEPKDDQMYTKVYMDDTALTVAVDCEETLYLNVSTKKLWAGEFAAGYYLVSDATDWNVKLGEKAEKVSEEDPAYVVKHLTVAAGTKVKFVNVYYNEGAHVDWFNAVEEKTSTQSEVKYSFDENANLVITNADTYSVFYNPEAEWYSIEDEDYTVTYTVKVNGTTSYELTLNEGTEYRTTTEVTVNPGDVVRVYKNANADDTFLPKPIGNNNLTAEYKVLVKATGLVYVDEDAKTLFVPGMEFGGYHLIVSGEFVKMTENTEPMDPSFKEYYSQAIEFKKDDVVSFVDTNAENDLAVPFDITTIDPESEEGAFAEVEGKLVAQKDCEVSVYLKLKSGEDSVYFGSVSPELNKAIEFAKGFNSAVGTACQAEESRTTAVIAAWGAQKTAFEALPEAVQNILKAATASDSQEDIRNFIAKYEYVAAKYNDALGTGYNFLGKTISPAAVTLIGSENTVAPVALIAIVASIALLSTASIITVVVIKRRRFSK